MGAATAVTPPRKGIWMNDAMIRPVVAIWAALNLGVALYVVVAAGLIATEMVEPVGLDLGIVRAVSLGIVAYMAGGLLIRRAMLARLPEEPGARTAQYRSATLIALALMESGGLVLITLGLLSGSLTWVVGGGSASIVMMLLTRPSQAELDSL